MERFRWLSILLVVALLLAGPLAPAGWAQQPQQPKAYEETVKAPDAPATEPGPAYQAGAVGVNLVRVPGKAVVCVIGGVVGFVALLITAGSGYRAAGRVVQEGCGGPWTITARDLETALKEESDRTY